METASELRNKLSKQTDGKWLDGIDWMVECHERALKSGDFKVAAFFYMLLEEAVEYVERMIDCYGDFGMDSVESFLLDQRMNAGIRAVHEHLYDVLLWMAKNSEKISEFVFMFDKVMEDTEMVKFLLDKCGMSVPAYALEKASDKGLDEFISLAKGHEVQA